MLPGVGVDGAGADGFSDGEKERFFGVEIGEAPDDDAVVVLGDSPDGVWVGCDEDIGGVRGEDRLANDEDGAGGGGVGDVEGSGDLVSGLMAREEFEEAQPLGAGEVHGGEPASGEFAEGVAAFGAASAVVAEEVDTSAPAAGTKALAIGEAIAGEQAFCVAFVLISAGEVVLDGFHTSGYRENWRVNT